MPILLSIHDAYWVFGILVLALAGFVWGRYRYDIVAMLALLAAVVIGAVPSREAFSGFGHPAVITVASVLVLSRGFQRSGLVDSIARLALKAGGNPTLQVLVLTATVAILSAFMNNVGALALLLPVAIRMAREHGTPPSRLLMPLAFGSLLGGLLTLIGTPPNIIISTYRAERFGEGFGMFSFAPVGGGVLVVGLVFLTLLGWRLTPHRKGQTSVDELFETADYISELEVGKKSKALGWTLWELEEACGEPIAVVAVLRGEKRIPSHRFHQALRDGDILLVEGEPEELKLLEEKGGLTIGGEKGFSGKLTEAKDLQILEVVVRADSRLNQRSVSELKLLQQYHLQLLAVARDGSRLKQRLGKIRLRAGDILLLQGEESSFAEHLPNLGCLPLANREITLGKPRRIILSVGLFAAAVTAMLLGWLTAPVALTLAAVLLILTGVLPLREAYAGIDWPILVLLGALIPVGQALETRGGTRLIAEAMLTLGTAWPPVLVLLMLFITTQALSNIINNAAAALLMAPIAVALAHGFEASIDPFLMAVAVAASCAFLTPIGHQSNTLVMGPGGYRFTDYAKVGLPLTILVIVTAIPLILLVWPM